MIDVQVWGNDPRSLAELIRDALEDWGLLGPEPAVAHLAVLLAREEDEAVRRRAAWRWLNRPVDRDNDWSGV